VLKKEISEFFQAPFADDTISLRNIHSKNAVILKLKGNGEQRFEILRCERVSCWSFAQRALRHIFIEGNTLAGFTGFEEIQIEEEAGHVYAFGKPLYEASVVIVRGSGRLNSLKSFYELLWNCCGFSTKMPRSLLMGDSFNETLDRRDALLVLSSKSEAKVKDLLEKGVRVALHVENERELDIFYRSGVRSFILSDFKNEYRERYADCFFILQEGDVASAIGKVDGLIVDIKEFSLEEIVLAGLVNRLLPLYVSAEGVDSKLLDVLGFGAIGWRRCTNPVFTRIEQKRYGIYEISYVSETNVPGRVRIDVSKDSVEWFFEQSEISLKKQTLEREDGRYFHFYREGVS